MIIRYYLIVSILILLCCNVRSGRYRNVSIDGKSYRLPNDIAYQVISTQNEVEQVKAQARAQKELAKLQEEHDNSYDMETVTSTIMSMLRDTGVVKNAKQYVKIKAYLKEKYPNPHALLSAARDPGAFMETVRSL